MTIRILGYDYHVKYSPSSEDGGMEHSGRCSTGKQTIIVDPDQAQQNRESTVLHEIIEALNGHLELNLEHRAVASLEAGLYQALRDIGMDMSQLLNEAEKSNV